MFTNTITFPKLPESEQNVEVDLGASAPNNPTLRFILSNIMQLKEECLPLRKPVQDLFLVTFEKLSSAMTELSEAIDASIYYNPQDHDMAQKATNILQIFHEILTLFPPQRTIENILGVFNGYLQRCTRPAAPVLQAADPRRLRAVTPTTNTTTTEEPSSPSAHPVITAPAAGQPIVAPVQVSRSPLTSDASTSSEVSYIREYLSSREASLSPDTVDEVEDQSTSSEYESEHAADEEESEPEVNEADAATSTPIPVGINIMQMLFNRVPQGNALPISYTSFSVPNGGSVVIGNFMSADLRNSFAWNNRA